MASKKLGKGLSSLLDHRHAVDAQEGGGPLWISPDALSASSQQPRKDLERGVAKLSESLRRHGMMQPIVVTELGEGQYEILAGERRWRAAQLAGMKQIPQLLRPKPTSAAERFELALIENIQREDLDAIEKAKACQKLLGEHGMTQGQIAERLGMERSTVANLVRLLELPTELQAAVSRETISAGHARALLRLNGSTLQQSTYEKILSDGLSVRATEALCVSADKVGAVTPRQARPRKPAWVADLQERITRKLGLKSEVRLLARGGGRLVLHFQDLEALDRLSTQLGVSEDESRELMEG